MVGDDGSAGADGVADNGSAGADGVADNGSAGDDGTVADDSTGTNPADPPAEPLLSPATKSSLLWGLVGGLSFLVLVQGYELIADPAIGFGAKFGVAVVVTVAAAATAHVARGKLPTETESP